MERADKAPEMPRFKKLCCSGVYRTRLASAVLELETDARRKCEKLTPRLPIPPGRIITGGLLGQCELVMEDREIDLPFTVKDRWEQER
jgi:hypothetical protein